MQPVVTTLRRNVASCADDYRAELGDSVKRFSSTGIYIQIAVAGRASIGGREYGNLAL